MREENKQLTELNNDEISVLLRGLKQMTTDSHQCKNAADFLRQTIGVLFCVVGYLHL
jgi:hypothetical protein